MCLVGFTRNISKKPKKCYSNCMKSILITDSLFIFPEHEQKLKDAGFAIERLDKPQATEDELIEALKGKQGYILGGIEQVTDKVIASTDTLEAICFTGSDWRWFVPGYELATTKGITITNCPGANSHAVAEYAMSLMLAMTREIFDLGRTGTKTFKTTKSLQGSVVGIIGMGHIGETMARILKTFGVKEVLYFSRTRKENLEKEIGMTYVSMEELLKHSDIVTLHTSKQAGKGYFNKESLKMMKDRALLVDCSFEGSVDVEALYQELSEGRLRAAFDGETHDERFKELPLNSWYVSNSSTAFNTAYANQAASDMATESIINLLSGKRDQYKAN